MTFRSMPLKAQPEGDHHSILGGGRPIFCPERFKSLRSREHSGGRDGES